MLTAASCRKIDELSAQVQHLQATLYQNPFPAASFHGVPAGNVFDPIPDGNQIDLGTAGQQIEATPPSFNLNSLDTVDQTSPSKRLADSRDSWPPQTVNPTPTLVKGNRLRAQSSRVLGDVSLANEQIDRLFAEYRTCLVFVDALLNLVQLLSALPPLSGDSRSRLFS